MDKEKIDKLLKQYINYNDYINIYNTFDDCFLNEDVNLEQRQSFIDGMDMILDTLNDDELFVITKLYNLECEPYLRKWTPGEVPYEEILLMDEFDFGKDKYFNLKNKAFKKINDKISMIDVKTKDNWLMIIQHYILNLIKTE
jgi:hypothetical protein